jgi:ABC-2 type transport system ATP-binding protein
LAQALIHDPTVLILDEPTTGLDPNQIIEIRTLISEVGKSKTVLLSTHIMQEVEAICQRTIIINKGVIVANATVDDLKKQYDKSLEEVFHELTRYVQATDSVQADNEAEKLKLYER